MSIEKTKSIETTELKPSESVEVEIELTDEQTGEAPEIAAAESEPVKPAEEPYGKRAEKRIRSLVSDRKRLEQQVLELQVASQSDSQKLLDLEVQQSTNEVSRLRETEARVKAELAGANSDYRSAREMDNYEAEAQAMERVAEAKTQLMAVDARKRHVETRAAEPTFEPAAVELPQPQADVLDPRTTAWVEKNSWFTEAANPTADTEVVEMAQMAGRLHNYATGVLQLDPAADADEYWNTIDTGLAREYPHRFEESDIDTEDEPVATTTAAPARRQVAAGARAPASGNRKRKVKITKEQEAFANRYGLNIQDLASEQAKINARKG